MPVEEKNGRVRFAVRVQPRAARTEIVGVQGDALKVRLSAPPVDGAANEALIDLLSQTLGVPRRSIRITSGASSKSKRVEIDGIDAKRAQELANR